MCDNAHKAESLIDIMSDYACITLVSTFMATAQQARISTNQYTRLTLMKIERNLTVKSLF